MTKFNKGDLVKVAHPHFGVLERGSSSSFSVRHGHIGIVLNTNIFPNPSNASNEYLEVYFQKRGKSGMILASDVEKA